MCSCARGVSGGRGRVERAVWVWNAIRVLVRSVFCDLSVTRASSKTNQTNKRTPRTDETTVSTLPPTPGCGVST